MTSPRGKVNKAPFQPYRVAGLIVFLVAALVLWLVFLQYKGDFTDKTKLTMLSDRAGLVMDPGSKVTYNGVQIGRVANIDEVERDGKPAVKFTLDVYPKYLHLIPANVDAKIVATTVFGEKYVSMTAPENPLPQQITPSTVIDARSVTTEINTLFQTITQIAEKVDPVKVNLTLSAAAQALSGLGDKFGQSIINGSAALDEINPRMPIIRHDVQQLARLGDTYANASPDLFDFLNNASTTAHTVTPRRRISIRRCWRRPDSAPPVPRSSTRAGRIWHVVPRIWFPRLSCWTPTARSSSARSATCTTANRRSPRLPVAPMAIRCGPRPKYFRDWGWPWVCPVSA